MVGSPAAGVGLGGHLVPCCCSVLFPGVAFRIVGWRSSWVRGGACWSADFDLCSTTAVIFVFSRLGHALEVQLRVGVCEAMVGGFEVSQDEFTGDA